MYISYMFSHLHVTCSLLNEFTTKSYKQFTSVHISSHMHYTPEILIIALHACAQLNIVSYERAYICTVAQHVIV